MEKSRTDEFLTRDEARRIAANVAKLLGSLLIPFEILIVRGMVFSAIMPPGWANLLAVGIDQPLPSNVTLCPEHARALQAQLKNPAQKIEQMSPAGGA